jgi:predicted N-acetyltransferase YhbS
MTALSLDHPKPFPPAADLSGFGFALERPQDAAEVDRLVDRAFGPGRFAKAAERLREGNRLRADLSVCAWSGERLVGAARQWPVLIGDTPAAFLGPFAVEPHLRGLGVGKALIRRACVLAEEAGERLTLLVGDLAYFGPLGFEPVAPGRVEPPGPVDLARVLWRPYGPVEGVGGPVRVPRAG